MISRSKAVTPPIADFLNQLEENRSNFARGIFPADGWIAPASDGGYSVRAWDKRGMKIEHCPTASDVSIGLAKLTYAVLSSPAVARHVSHQFYKEFYEAVDARRPRLLTAAEAKLCGGARKIAEAMPLYLEAIRNRDENEDISRDEATRTLRTSTFRIDRFIRRANSLLANVEFKTIPRDLRPPSKSHETITGLQ